MSRNVVRIDCHVHTRGSYDSEETVDGVIKGALTAGLDGFVVTDHDDISFARVAAERADAFGLICIPGVEISTRAGHLLGIGVNTRPPAGLPFAETVSRVRRAGGIAVVPHPFQRSRDGVSAASISDCDGVEVFNAHSLTGLRNLQAARFARHAGYPKFAGSDAHRAGAVGFACTEVGVDTPTPTRRDVLKAMRDGRVSPVGSRIPASQYVRHLARNARSNSRRLLRLG
jgi:predicted metal-dependent phosphoesterase TrpH